MMASKTTPATRATPPNRHYFSALGLGGHHLGAARDEQAAVVIVHAAMDGGVTFFDNCWEYNRGKSRGLVG